MLYTYVLGCGIACLALAGVSAMDTVEVCPARLAARVLLWPAALLVWLLGRRGGLSHGRLSGATHGRA